MQTARQQWKRRRTTAVALKQQLAETLTAALPQGWICQVLPGAKSRGTTGPDILVISPRGACHFLFVRAPADRWWDGGPRTVDAETFSPADVSLARRLRAAGHRARGVRSRKDLWRALTAWGCPARQGGTGGKEQEGGRGREEFQCRMPGETLGRPPQPTARPILRLSAWRGQADV